MLNGCCYKPHWPQYSVQEFYLLSFNTPHVIYHPTFRQPRLLYTRYLQTIREAFNKKENYKDGIPIFGENKTFYMARCSKFFGWWKSGGPGGSMGLRGHA